MIYRLLNKQDQPQITIILKSVVKKIRFVKYFPAVELLPFMIYNFITMYIVTSESLIRQNCNGDLTAYCMCKFSHYFFHI